MRLPRLVLNLFYHTPCSMFIVIYQKLLEGLAVMMNERETSIEFIFQRRIEISKLVSEHKLTCDDVSKKKTHWKNR